MERLDLAPQSCQHNAGGGWRKSPLQSTAQKGTALFPCVHRGSEDRAYCEFLLKWLCSTMLPAKSILTGLVLVGTLAVGVAVRKRRARCPLLLRWARRPPVAARAHSLPPPPPPPHRACDPADLRQGACLQEGGELRGTRKDDTRAACPPLGWPVGTASGRRLTPPLSPLLSSASPFLLCTPAHAAARALLWHIAGPHRARALGHALR